jgi:hypothetical protein
MSFNNNDDLYRTKKCRFGDRCNRRENCWSAHSADELRVAKCRFGNNCYKLNPQCLDVCEFWHPCDDVTEEEYLEQKKAEYFPVVVENRAGDRQNTKLCANMKENEPCVADGCTFAHSFNDLLRRGMCLKTRRDCKYGERCVYFHIGEDKEAYVRAVQGIEAKAWMYRASSDNYKPLLMNLEYLQPSEEVEAKKTDYVGRGEEVFQCIESFQEEEKYVVQTMPAMPMPFYYEEHYEEEYFEPCLSPEQVGMLVQMAQFEMMIASYRARLMEQWQEALEMNEVMDEIESYENEDDVQDEARLDDLEDEFQAFLIDNEEEDYDEELTKFEIQMV